jgi:hypothetical protein
MKIPEYLSYSALSSLEKNPEDFYARRLAKHRPPREPQTQPMAVGSAFDAYAKANLHATLFGQGADPRYEFSAIFEAQVDKEHRDFGLIAGKHVFKAYEFCGAYGDLLKELEQSIEPPQFEFTVQKEIGGVPFQGKPDCRFVLDIDGRINCIYDWKVRGYCSKHGVSPTPGYATCLDCFKAKKQSRSHGREHGKYLGKPFHGVTVNAGYFETCSTDYADQLCLYGWLLDEKPGDETVVLGIEEFVAKFMGEGKTPRLRYARHRALCKREYQLKLLERVKAAWARITSGHFFNEMSKEDSDARCALLDDIGLTAPAETETEQWFDDVTKERSW